MSNLNFVRGKFARSKLTKIPLAFSALFLTLGLAGCVTVEGTNALVSAETFEREVATETLKGLGIIDRENKEVIKSPRAPLALPKNSSALPAPTSASIAKLPEDSDRVQIDASGLTEEDIKHLRNARVVDLRALSGRPLTEAESRKLIARMKAARIELSQNVARPLYLPPDEYFTVLGDVNLVCLAKNGDLVSLKDPRCPPEIRQALSN
ncbi:hypothetical protein MNBD_GAMMA03-308 [hydrothermal vent metagenome]|uniref:Uncharacterized protein n=1 Tax=hydrothermal vent metagenome TaxID=652676 RepID=A0A3B0W1B4_9ZZZZ